MMMLNNSKKKKFAEPIGVLMGGCSSEREISLKSGRAVVDALNSIGCDVKAIDIESERSEDICALIKQAHIKVAFIALHGRFGEDGKIQKILEQMNMPYTGSGSEASCIALSKILTYKKLEEKNIVVPDYFYIRKSDEPDVVGKVTARFKSFPLIVKPCSEGSSIGITVVQREEDLLEAIDVAFSYDSEVIVESYIQGKELTVGILGDKLLPVVEIKTRNSFFDFEAKYQTGLTDYIVPAEIDNLLAKEIQNVALDVHRVLGCRHLSRVDFILNSENIIYVLEINTIPGMTSTSLLPKAAGALGIDFPELCLTIIELAYGSRN